MKAISSISAWAVGDTYNSEQPKTLSLLDCLAHTGGGTGPHGIREPVGGTTMSRCHQTVPDCLGVLVQVGGSRWTVSD